MHLNLQESANTPFTFTNVHLQELDEIASQMANTFIALVCVKDREIACLPLATSPRAGRTPPEEKRHR